MPEPGEQPAAPRSGPDLWSWAGRALTALLVGGALYLLAYETLHRVIAVEPIPSTKATAELGLTPEVAAQHLRDGLATIAAGVDGVNQPNLSLDADKPDMTLPGVGISIDAIAAYIRGILHIGTVRDVSGDFTEARGRVWLRMRVDGKLVYQTPADGVDPAHAQEELDHAARMVSREITPYLYAAYLHNNRDPAAADTLREIITAGNAGPSDTADAHRLWGQILAEQADGDGALQHYDEAMRLYQTDDATARIAALQNYIGQAHYQSHDYDHAEDAYRQAIMKAPFASSAAIASLDLGDVFRERQPDSADALAAYRYALWVEPHLRYARDAEGRVLEAMGRYQDAAASYEASISDYPGDAQSYDRLWQLIVRHPDAFQDPKGMLDRVCELSSVAGMGCSGGP